MNWDWILFDADETLFTFDAFGGLQRMFLDYSVTFTAEDFQDYQAINKPLWVDYQNGAINALQLQHQRFQGWSERLSIPAGDLNAAFLNAMAEICAPLPGAISLLDSLKGKVKLGIITNGFTALQQIRLERTGLRDFFDLLVISEQVGIAKPDRRIFDYAFEQMGNPPRDRVMMVGDTAESDILGGINAGLATCWLNAHGRSLPEGINPTWQVSSLGELEQLLCKP
ncbi:pyrimidine 5'-nucleotidase [Dryocola sp. BD613]|uniref:pyrimidine 5'-nucleotidase n=1 Tax=Dryocola sp. BD613 TaxID=3133272 RepID=UPI003F507FAA